MDVWDRQPTETAKQHAAFEVYRTLPPPRSLVGAYRKYAGKAQAKQPDRNWSDWFQQHQWEVRARAWDAYVARAAQQAEVDAHIAAAKKRVNAYEMLLGAGTTIIKRAELGNLRLTAARKMIPTALHSIDTAAKGLRVEAGDPETITRSEQTGAGGGPVAVTGSSLSYDTIVTQLGAILQHATPDERDALITEYDTYMAVAQRLQARLSPPPPPTEETP